MIKHLRSNPIALVALFLALGGTSYAAGVPVPLPAPAAPAYASVAVVPYGPHPTIQFDAASSAGLTAANFVAVAENTVCITGLKNMPRNLQVTSREVMLPAVRSTRRWGPARASRRRSASTPPTATPPATAPSTVLARFGGTLSREDAEDVVSEALLRIADRIPAHAGHAWFARVVLNRAEDFRRARDGRPRTGQARRFVALDEHLVADAPEDGFERELARRTVHRALNRLPYDHRTLLRRRHLHGAPRREIASALGLTVTQFEKRHAIAWSALEHVVAADEPTPSCRPVRRLPRRSPHVAAHVSECLSCRLVLR